ncbi:sulfate adenylate transferase subunit 1 [Neisseria animaloris]|uniref:sulfate adenylyltransferase subunit 1 n=1 Tax=Neisseria animaloris TaxID=326522 RepID=UPI000A18BC11|nr:GTP-binding protein [Neisseria animaloris]OSI07515.1 sulfate adenylyltransferase [Neisseria animaloris]VEH86970.1 sulfate adenylate transferase subunit 1 [Neisseria animaloris]
MNATTAPLLRFITAGSVDDGKSTLIGRLLYDSKTLLADQLAKLDHAAQNGQTPDFASLTDGLAAEREQGITIDVAYRYFATPKRKFIIADTPGHEQYTRNMVTGASTADAAIVLVDATRVDFDGSEPTLLPQTKRHSAVLKLLGTPHIIVAVNKLDLLGFDAAKYQAIIKAYQKLAAQIGLTAQIHFLPISALNGDNIVTPSGNTPWYDGLPLLPLLESLPVVHNRADNLPAHFPVQRVARQDGSSSDDFRGYQGRLEAGRLKTGDEIKVLPGGKTAKINGIYHVGGKTDSARAGDVLTITLDSDIDISRGDSIVAADSSVAPSRDFQTALCWFDETPLNLRRKYLLKQGTQTTAVKVSGIAYVWDVHTLSRVQSADSLNLNDIGSVSLKTQQPLSVTTYAENPATGAFILIDEATNHTVAAGMIRTTGEPGNMFEI